MQINKPVADRAAVRIFPPAVPLLTIVIGLVLGRSVPLGLDLHVSLRILGAALVVGAVALLGAWSAILLRRSGQSENPWKPTTGVIQTGPFRLTRNPMYLQMVLVCIGSGFALSNMWILLLTPCCAGLLQVLAIRPEEEYLERKFGSEFLAYKQRVRRWL